MGIRGELFSTKVSLQNRTYFFNVKENRMGDLYLNVVESKNRETGGFERQSVIVFADDLREFLKGFDDSLKVMEKAAREKRKGNRTHDQDGKPGREKYFEAKLSGDSRASGDSRPSSSSRPQREKNFGDRATRTNRTSGDSRPQREKNFGDRTTRTSRTSGDRPHREKNFGNRSPRDRSPLDRQQAKPRKRVVRKKD